jgi:hypothetical protein
MEVVRTVVHGVEVEALWSPRWRYGVGSLCKVFAAGGVSYGHGIRVGRFSQQKWWIVVMFGLMLVFGQAIVCFMESRVMICLVAVERGWIFGVRV